MKVISVLALVLLPACCFAAQYSVLTVAPMDSSTPILPTYGLFLNDLGEVAGTFGMTGPDIPLQRAFRTQPDMPFNAATDAVGVLESPNAAQRALDLNDAGQVLVMEAQNFLTDGSGKVNGATQALGTVPVSFVNDQGELAAVNSNGVAYRTQPGQPYNPATDNLGIFAIRGLNNSGQVLGNTNSGIAAGSSFLTAPDGPVVLGNLGPDFFGEAVNDLGQVAGLRYPGQNEFDIFLTAPNQPSPNGTDFGTINAVSMIVTDVNDEDELVGSIGGGYTFVGIDGQIINLNTLIDPSLDLDLTQALQINDNGQILALAQDPSGNDSVVLLTPIPEPTSLTLLSVSSLLLARPKPMRPVISPLRTLESNETGAGVLRSAGSAIIDSSTAVVRVPSSDGGSEFAQNNAIPEGVPVASCLAQGAHDHEHAFSRREEISKRAKGS